MNLKKIGMLVCFLLIFSFKTVSAKSIENYYGIIINDKEYKTLSKYYSEDFLYFMDDNEYSNIISGDLNNIRVNEYDLSNDKNIVPFATTISTNYKTLRIVNNSGYITISLSWTTMPKVRSYDVIAARLVSTSISGDVVFKQTFKENGMLRFSREGYIQRFDNGIGYSFKLSDNNDLKSYLSFRASGSGIIYASYQHSQKNITLEKSKQYTLAPTGYGSVILFNNNVKNNYDAMNGVSISL